MVLTVVLSVMVLVWMSPRLMVLFSLKDNVMVVILVDGTVVEVRVNVASCMRVETWKREVWWVVRVVLL